MTFMIDTYRFRLFFNVLSIGFLLFTSAQIFSQSADEEQAIRAALLESERIDKDKMLKTDPDSPLTEDQKKQFTGLDYFAVDPKFKVFARLNRYEEQGTAEVRLSNNKTGYLIRFGTVTFSLKGTVVSLTVFRDQDLPELTETPGSLFIPFADETTEHETYYLGRYLVIDRPADEQSFHLDFNRAINPYSAYNSRFLSIIPPRENYIPVAVKAGEKKFETAGK